MTYKTATYPALGARVNYVRQKVVGGEFEQGRGTVIAICLDDRKRPMVHLEAQAVEGNNPHERFNVDMNCIDPTPEFIEKLKGVSELIQKTSQEGNERIQKLVNKYNSEVDKHYTNFHGDPVEFEYDVEPEMDNVKAD